VIVSVVGDIDARRLQMLRDRVDGDVLGQDGADPDAAPDALFVWAQRRPVLAEILRQHGRHLRWVHFRRVGIAPSILGLFDPFAQIQLTNGSGASGVAVAEHTLALLLALLKRLPVLHESQRQHAWPREFPAFELRGQTACIVGLGDVGLSVARVLRPLGVRLLGVRRRAEHRAEVDETYTPDALHRVLPRCTILILAAPSTPATQDLIGAEELALLPAGAWVINVGRGSVLDEAALIAALQEGRLSGAGLDVLADEPPPPSSPLWDMPNVIITPHSAAHTAATDDRSVELFLENLDRFRLGRPLLSRM
jgi:phosphoglycerate dehydrogenase-like enzyme